ncbi:MAG: hypothetical protein IPK71_29515 [Myxococcales bacterium]|nr:hypothetical protein [Myxococcales bacterium]
MMPRFRSFRARLPSRPLPPVVALPAHAVGTRTFVLDSIERLSGGDLKGVAVGSDGVVRAGLTLGNAPLGSDVGQLRGPRAEGRERARRHEPQGKIMRVVGTPQPYADTGGLAVTALAELKDGTVIAATIPDGKLFQGHAGQGHAVRHLGRRRLRVVPRGGRARHGRLRGDGRQRGQGAARAGRVVEVVYKSDEPHLVSVALAPNGDVYAGSSGNGASSTNQGGPGAPRSSTTSPAKR